MVYLLQKYFAVTAARRRMICCGRRSGDADSPRMLGAFNEATPDWLSFFMFTYFTDRTRKMQLHSLAQSGFDPLSRTCRFMADRGSPPHVRRRDRLLPASCSAPATRCSRPASPIRATSQKSARSA